jgi:putative aminopeptidase FrvX
MMDPAKLAKESPEVRDAIVAKSKRIAIPYSKGAYQYVTDGAEIQTLGRKIK